MKKMKHSLPKVQKHLLVLLLIINCLVLPIALDAQDRYEIVPEGVSEYLYVPGLVYALRHNVNQGPVPLDRTIKFPGGDHGASAGEGFFYVAMPDGRIH